MILAHIIRSLLLAMLLASSMTTQAMLINGDFEAGDLTGWTTFTTANGSLGDGGGTVTSFDTTGSGASLAATFRVGQLSFTSGVPAGGGIFQTVNLAAAGNYSLSAYVAAFAPVENVSAGIFDLLFDGSVLATVDISDIAIGATERGLLAGSTFAAAGSHEIRLRVQRSYETGNNSLGITPLQYIDNISLTNIDNAVPTPATLALFGLGLAGLGWSRRKKA